MKRGTMPEQWEYQEKERGENIQAGVLGIRTKTIKSGEFLESEIYPLVHQDHAEREARKKKSAEKIKANNEKRARKKLIRILNANFGPGDLFVHLTSEADCSEAEYQKRVQNYMRRVKYRYHKAGMKTEYAYVNEGTGAEGREKWHTHMVLKAGPLSRDELEDLWQHGLVRVDRAKDQPKGMAGFALYITQKKATQEKLLKRRWACSKGLKNPEKSETVSDHKFTRRATWKIEEAVRNDDWAALRRIYAKKYPGYELIETPEVRYSEYLPGAYVYAWLRKIPIK